MAGVVPAEQLVLSTVVDNQDAVTVPQGHLHGFGDA